MVYIAREVAEIALSKASGQDFERYANAVFSSLFGAEFVPLGGMHDGGADGYQLEDVFERQSHPDQFFQVTTEKDVKSKAKRTLAALKKNERAVRRLTIATSQIVPSQNILAEQLLEDLDVIVTIYKQEYFLLHLNESPQLIGHFNQYLRHYTDFLQGLGAASLPTHSVHVTDPTVFVSLLKRQTGPRVTGEN